MGEIGGRHGLKMWIEYKCVGGYGEEDCRIKLIANSYRRTGFNGLRKYVVMFNLILESFVTKRAVT